MHYVIPPLISFIKNLKAGFIAFQRCIIFLHGRCNLMLKIDMSMHGSCIDHAWVTHGIAWYMHGNTWNLSTGGTI